jgi:hypothetical protein
MTLPPGVTPVMVTGKVTTNKGITATGGSVSFRMPYPLANGVDHVVMTPGVWTYPIASDGTLTTAADPMPAGTITGISPSGWAYEITIDATLPGGATWHRKFFAVINADASLEQLLAAAAPTPAPAASYLPLSAVGATVAPLVGGKVPPEYLPPGGGGAAVETVAALNGTIDVDNTDPANPKIGVGAVPQSAVTNLTTDLGALTAGVSSAVGTANSAASAAATAQTTAGNAATAATEAQATADAAQSTASAAYVKPGGGIPGADLSAAVQADLALAHTAVQSVPASPDPAAARFGGHSCNIPLYVCRDLSTINGEVWVALVPVKAGVPIGGAFTFRADGTAAWNGTSGLNGFAIYDVPAGGGAGNLLGSSVSDDTMWVPNAAKIDKPISGVPTPTADGLRAVAVSVRNYSDAPEFLFQNMAGTNGKLLATLFAKYKGGGYTNWPLTLDYAADLTDGTGFIPSVFLRS